jgi:hypothetical protein
LKAARLERFAFAACGALLCTAQVGCSILLDTSADQCSTNQDCINRKGLFSNSICQHSVCVPQDTDSGAGGGMPDANVDPVWGCLGHVTPGMPTGMVVNVSLPFFDLVSMTTLTGVGVRACPKLDVTCSRPVNTTIAIADAMGLATFQAPSGFDGYGQIIELTDAGDPIWGPDGGADDGGDGGNTSPPLKYIPSVVFFNPPIIHDTAYGIVPIFKPGDIDALALAQGNHWDRNYGLLFVGMLDCSRKPAAGVTWEYNALDPLTKRFYYVNGLPDELAPSTDASGFGGLVNARAGSITITAKLQSSQVRVGEATVIVKAGAASYIYLPPTP